MIGVSGLTKHYGQFQALADVSFTVERGEVVGFLGPNGAGKTTTMKILTGYLRPTAGSASIAGLDVVSDSLAIRRRIGYLPESAPLYTDLFVEEYLGFCADIRGMSRKLRRERIASVGERCGIADVLTVPIGHLSKGYRQRVGLAQALLHDPELLILDEPTTGLDPNQIVEIRRLLRDVGKDKTIILSTHILREVEATCDRVLIVHQGRMVADATPAELQKGDTLIVRGTGATPQAALEVFRTAPGFRDVAIAPIAPDAPEQGFHLRIKLGRETEHDPGAEAFRVARDRGLCLYEIRREDATLEQVFQELTAAA